ncbi:MAG: S8 family serine peptidase [Pseudomonadales bacterium]|nr:S8 family serine peptidase [Pseudomonadales bacterium]
MIKRKFVPALILATITTTVTAGPNWNRLESENIKISELILELPSEELGKKSGVDYVEGKLKSLTNRLGLDLGAGNITDLGFGNYFLLNLESSPRSYKQIQNVYEKLERSKLFKSITVNARERSLAYAPADPLYHEQLSINDSNAEYTSNVQYAWDYVQGNPNVVIAVLDAGIPPSGVFHDTKTPLKGFDFVGDFDDDRDPNIFGWPRVAPWTYDSNTRRSPGTSSHMDRVAGQIFYTHNSTGLAGIDRFASFLPIRIVDNQGMTTPLDMGYAIMWAVNSFYGAHIPQNANPADIINISQAILGECPQVVQNSINIALVKGASIIASAGNTRIKASEYWPGNCDGVITVAGTEIDGLTQEVRASLRSAYDDGGSTSKQVVEMWAPFDVMVYEPNDNRYSVHSGTSFSSPIVAGILSLAKAINPTITDQEFIDLVNLTGKPVERCRTIGTCPEKAIDAYELLKALH